MATFSVGTNWDPSLVLHAAALNKENNAHKISGFYGSIPGTAAASARPDWRLKGGFNALASFTKMAHDEGLEISYTLNAFCLGGYREEHIAALTKLIMVLEDFGVDRFTVAHPIMAEIVLRVTKRPKIGLSTILNIDDARVVEVWRELYQSKRIDQVCVAVEANRDGNFLKWAPYFGAMGIELQLMVNEFCNINGPCHGVYRDSCYMGHSHGVRDRMNNYPMSRCINARATHPEAWLKACFILPSWVRLYETEFKLSRFKITGRTGTTGYIKRMMSFYARQQNPKHLLELWSHLETFIGNKVAQEEVLARYPKIPVAAIVNHIVLWLSRNKGEREYWRCRHTVCSRCGYCSKALEMALNWKET